MTTLLLDTGVLDHLEPHVTGTEPNNKPTPVEQLVYPTSHNPDTILISVGRGNMVVVTAYKDGGIKSNEILADLYKVLLAEPVPTDKINPCCFEPRPIETTVVGESKMCAWSLEGCKPLVVIDIPGVYRLDPVDPDITVSAVSHPISDYNYANLRG